MSPVAPGEGRRRTVTAVPTTWLAWSLLPATVLALLGGLVATWAGAGRAAELTWAAGTVAALVPSLVWVAAALRRGRVGVDLLAVLSLVGTLLVGEYLAGALIAVMVATGRALESAAERRASRDLRALSEHVPRTARRRVGDVVDVVALDDVEVGDLLVVGPGEVVPVDGRIRTSAALLDESVLTGESVLVDRAVGESVRSGVVNAGGAFEVHADRIAADSTYAGLVRLAQEAGAESAPIVRLADRYAAWFVPLALAVAAAAWIVGGSAVRAVAVLVVATPCPLLLAAPVAIVSGLSRATKCGVVVRSGAALESLGRARTLVLDKTGTLTQGRPRVIDVAAAPGWTPSEVVRLAASADQVSPHVLAAAIVAHARTNGMTLSVPSAVVEEPGRGVSAVVEGSLVRVGRRSAPPSASWTRSVAARALLDGATVVWVGRGGHQDSTDDEADDEGDDVVGAILLRDPLRRDATRTLRRLRTAGLRRLVLLTGDRATPAREVGAMLGLDDVRAEQSPADKVAAVRAEREEAVTVMVGDGVNDAPALAAATVGVAMGSRGATAASEAADVVLTVDRLDRLADVMGIARRSRRLAVQSALVGMGLSLLAMAVAAVGLLPPAAGALLQEGIDVAVILNALRALRPGRPDTVTLPADAEALVHRFEAEHRDLADALPALRDAADLLADQGATPVALDALREADQVLTSRLLPHEHAEEAQLYPALTAPLGGTDATAPMTRAHVEIDRLARRLSTHLDLAAAAGELEHGQVDDLLATVYGLHALLRLHFAQEEEEYFALAKPTSDVPRPTDDATRAGRRDRRPPS
ncbi:heavy metal translocating P-type ATPase [Pseudonocardia dioxanivorans]|uniref:heavy metal translocating P-type ATPase n=1 Tax=Pseudonocardia dioxanivorans TaxID=240495 RepID=UPI000CD2EA25|nr:heavy metal translocating P-type ATPase [Pseudonocardia dioxanivorans]